MYEQVRLPLRDACHEESCPSSASFHALRRYWRSTLNFVDLKASLRSRGLGMRNIKLIQARNQDRCLAAVSIDPSNFMIMVGVVLLIGRQAFGCANIDALRPRVVGHVVAPLRA